MTSAIDYERRIWGYHAVDLSPRSINALRLKYFLVDLASVKGRILEVGCGGGSMAKARESGVDQKTRLDDYLQTPIGLPEPLSVGPGTFQEESPRQ